MSQAVANDRRFTSPLSLAMDAFPVRLFVLDFERRLRSARFFSGVRPFFQVR